MAAVTGLTAARMLAIEAASVVDGEVVGDDLILTKHDGSTVNAGNVRGPTDPTDTAATPGTIVVRDASGNVKAADPVDDEDVVTKNYLDAQVKDGVADISTARLRLTATDDASASSTQHALQIGPTSGVNLILDGNEIMARNNGVPGAIYSEGGYSVGADPAGPNEVTRRSYVDGADLRLRQMRLAQSLLTGGGIRKVTSASVAWGTRFIVMGLGKNSAASGGYFDITMPPDGTVIPLLGNAASTVTVASGAIPLTGWQALYYDLPLGGTFTSDPARFYIMDDSLTSADVPETWILVVRRNNETTRQPQFTWGDGVRQDYWRTFSPMASWVAYGSTWPAPAWRFNHDGSIELRGLMKNGITGVANPFMSLTDFAPDGGTTTGHMNFQPSNTGLARVDVMGNGGIAVVSFLTGGSNAFVSLDKIRWFPAGT